MIGNDFRDIYVAACGQPCPTRREGYEHEWHCPQCAEELGRVEQERDPPPDESFYNWPLGLAMLLGAGWLGSVLFWFLT
jgi:hypothetical protein